MIGWEDDIFVFLRGGDLRLVGVGWELPWGVSEAVEIS